MRRRHHCFYGAHKLMTHAASHVGHEKGVAWFLFLCTHVVIFLYLQCSLLGSPLGCSSSKSTEQLHHKMLSTHK